ncbi:MAG: hypothetical protein KC609_22695 [Myxococcales bacterium]|nr:hypothetical protein [Myxococcales bacterium]
MQMIRRQTPLALSMILAVATITLTSPDLRANDGRDRHRGSIPTTFVHLFAPLSPKAGFRVLAHDMRGGADGDPMFRWARRESVALVQVLAFRTAQTLGVGALPMAIFDLSAENGDTPVQLSPGKPPRGRHPGGSHDGGINLDLGYFLTSDRGKHFSPDLAACTEHFLTPDEARRKKRDPKVAVQDAWRCRGRADRLDVVRQSYFYVELFRLHLEAFGGDLLEEIGVDEMVARAVLAQVQRWVVAKKYHATPRLVAEMRRIFNFSPYEGWAFAHHHHTHLRLRSLRPDGRHRVAFERLRAEARRALLAQTPRRSGLALALDAQLSSSALVRTLWVRLIVGDGSAVRRCRFRLDKRGAWHLGEWASRPCEHELDLGSGVLATARSRTVEVEVQLADGRRVVLERRLREPRKPAFLFVEVDPRRISGELSCSLAGSVRRCTLRLRFPRAYEVYLTGVRYLVARRDGSERTVVGERKSGASTVAEIDVSRAAIWLVRAELTLSKRYRVIVPLFAGR